jgi:endonuclease/exonuclease/phosphatase family metal-dependent hydrolase
VYSSHSIPIGALLLASTLLAPCAARAPNTEGNALVIEVMSFNIRWGPDPEPNGWDLRRDLVLALLREEAPDVVGLQESRDEYVDDLLPHLPDYAAYPQSGERKNSILYRAGRFRLDRATSDEENARVDAPEKDWGPGSVRLPRCVRLVEKPSGTGFYLYNNHLDHRSAESREWSVRVLIDRIRSRRFADPVILTGDFNAGPKSPVLGFLRGETSLGSGENAVSNPILFIDTFDLLHSDETSTGTYHGFRGLRLGARIDYVLVRPQVEVREARILHREWEGRYPSDHFPVTATVLLAPGPALRR